MNKDKIILLIIATLVFVGSIGMFVLNSPVPFGCSIIGIVLLCLILEEDNNGKSGKQNPTEK